MNRGSCIESPYLIIFIWSSNVVCLELCVSNFQISSSLLLTLTVYKWNQMDLESTLRTTDLEKERETCFAMELYWFIQNPPLIPERSRSHYLANNLLWHFLLASFRRCWFCITSLGCIIVIFYTVCGFHVDFALIFLMSSSSSCISV